MALSAVSYWLHFFMIHFAHVCTGHSKHALTFNIHGVLRGTTIRASRGCSLQDHDSKEELHLLGHKAFIYIQVRAAGSAEESSQQRFTPVSLLEQRSASPTQRASGASLSAALLPPPPHACTPHPPPPRIKQHHKK